MELFVEPRIVKNWSQFKLENPPYSIALDGYVKGKPRFSEKGPYANFNHHEEVDRLSTRATCGQIYVAIKQGLIDSFRKDGLVKGNIFVNDPDQDTCMAVWLLQNHERIAGCKSEPLINKITYVEDMLDVTAGAYPFDPSGDSLLQAAWVFQPYTDARAGRRVAKMNAEEMRTVIEAVCGRISEYALGKAQKLAPDVRYERIGGGENWAMIKEIGAQARSELFHSGIKAYVSAIKNGGDRYQYVFGKMSPFIIFPITEFYDILNQMEGIPKTALDKWGGNAIIGGSPRMAGTTITPSELERVINEHLKKKRSLQI